MSERTPKLLIEDILASAHKILLYTEGLNFEEFQNDSKTIDAVVRNFEIIGEAANKLPEDLRTPIVQLIGVGSEALEIVLSTIISVLIIQLYGK